MPRVTNLFICPKAGEPMVDIHSVQAIAGVGLEGDRYATHCGTYSNVESSKVRHVTLIAIEDIRLANQALVDFFITRETRRNIVTTGVALITLIGKEFHVGSVKMRGVEECTPCNHPSKLTHKLNFKSAFENRGGLRDEILTSGIITAGDTITLPS